MITNIGRAKRFLLIYIKEHKIHTDIINSTVKSKEIWNVDTLMAEEGHRLLLTTVTEIQAIGAALKS